MGHTLSGLPDPALPWCGIGNRLSGHRRRADAVISTLNDQRSTGANNAVDFMKIHILSDLHNEFSLFTPCKVIADVVVLAGDIDFSDTGIRWARQSWPDKQIIYVVGNHEYYRCEITNTRERLRQTANELQVHLLDPGEVIIEGVRFLGCTLWTDFRLFGDDMQARCLAQAAQGLNDFRVISNGAGAFSPQDSLEMHKKERAWLNAKLDETYEGKTVVVTHHLPSRKSVSARYQDDLLSACFASPVDHLFGKSLLWIHGHTHDSFDYIADGTRVLCNPRGYSRYNKAQENFDFVPGLVIEI
jgi:hypothetical protein